MADRNAVILLSGGLDSTTLLAIAQEQGFTAHALSFRYGQRHTVELDAARADRSARQRRSPCHRRHRPPHVRRLGADQRRRDSQGSFAGGDGRRHPGHLCPGAEHGVPLVRHCIRGGAPGATTSSSASTPWTTAGIPTAGRSTSRRTSGWRTSRRAAASRDSDCGSTRR